MSYIDTLKDIDRAGDRSVTQQMVDAVASAISSGELTPGDRLPATRELAGLVGVNHLTAVRAYRRLREQGLVTARVGAGTFVRDPRAVDASDDEPGWQRYVLPTETRSAASRATATAQEAAFDADVIPFSVGYAPTRALPDHLIAGHLAAAFAGHGPGLLQYGPIEGIPELRAQLAAERDDDPDTIMVVNGAMQGLSLAARVLVRPGEAVAVESPTFMGIIEVLRQAGARVLPVPVDEHGMDTDELARLAVREDLRAVFVQSRVQNPTGYDLAPERAERLLELARRHAFFVVDDEVWSEVRFNGVDGGPLRRMAPAHVIALGSLSKTLGGGLRLGWRRASEGMIERLALAKHTHDLQSPTLAQHAVARLLAAGEYPAIRAQVRDEYARGRALMLEALARHLEPVAPWPEPAGGACVLVTLRQPLDERALVAQAERAGVSVVPGSAVTPGPPAATMLRLSYGFVEPELIEPGVRRLAQAIRAVGAERRTRQAFPLS